MPYLSPIGIASVVVQAPFAFAYRMYYRLLGPTVSPSEPKLDEVGDRFVSASEPTALPSPSTDGKVECNLDSVEDLSNYEGFLRIGFAAVDSHGNVGGISPEIDVSIDTVAPEAILAEPVFVPGNV